MELLFGKVKSSGEVVAATPQYDCVLGATHGPLETLRCQSLLPVFTTRKHKRLSSGASV